MKCGKEIEKNKLKFVKNSLEAARKFPANFSLNTLRNDML